MRGARSHVEEMKELAKLAYSMQEVTLSFDALACDMAKFRIRESKPVSDTRGKTYYDV